MNGSGRKSIIWLLPLFFLFAGCERSVTAGQDAEPEEVETCERLIPIGIGLVNDYFYTLEDSDIGVARGDVNLLPPNIRVLNARGEELDQRAAELVCDLDELNGEIVDATSGLESSDPVVQLFLDTVRSGVVGGAVEVALVGEWQLVAGSFLGGGVIELAPDQTITLIVDETGSGSGSTGCNEYTIGGTARNGKWLVEGFHTTAVGCPSYAEAENDYLNAFLAVTDYSVEDGSLTVTGSDVTLRFIRVVSEE